MPARLGSTTGLNTRLEASQSADGLRVRTRGLGIVVGGDWMWRPILEWVLKLKLVSNFFFALVMSGGL